MSTRDHLNEIGITLTAENDIPKLFELLALGTKSFADAAGGSLQKSVIEEVKVSRLSEIDEFDKKAILH